MLINSGYSEVRSLALRAAVGEVRTTARAEPAIGRGPELRPVTCCYIKVYCKTRNGDTIFYKDGYTDFNGRFDYVGLSSSESDSVEFAILACSDEFGSVVSYAKPPTIL